MANKIDVALQKIRDTAISLGKDVSNIGNNIAESGVAARNNLSKGLTNFKNQYTVFADPTSNNGQNYWSQKRFQNLPESPTAQFIQGYGEGTRRGLLAQGRFLGETGYQIYRKIVDPKYQDTNLPDTKFLQPEQIKNPTEIAKTGMASTIRTMLAVKGLANPASNLIGNVIAGGTSYGINKLQGADDLTAAREAGRSAGYSPVYTGINNITGPMYETVAGGILGQAPKLLPKILTKGAINAAGNVLENEVFTPLTELRRPTKEENLTAGATGFLFTGATETGKYLKDMTTRSPSVEISLKKLGDKWKPGDTPIKPPKMPRAQWDFQLKVNAKLGRNPYTPVYPKDLQDAIDLGLSVRVKGGTEAVLDAQAKADAQGRLYDQALKTPGVKIEKGSNYAILPNGDYITPEGVNIGKSSGKLDFTSREELLRPGITQQPISGVTKDMSDIQNRTGSVANQQLPNKSGVENLESQKTNTILQSNPSDNILSLPKPKYEVSTKAQMERILKKDPNADVKIVLKPSGKTINMTDGPIPTREQVASTIPGRINNFTKDVLGYSTEAPRGGTREAGGYTRLLRKGQEAITSKIEEGLGSSNPIIRNAASTLQNFFRGLGMSPARAEASANLRGEMAVANQRAYNVMDTLYQSLGNNKESLKRINAVLDPELAKTKVTFEQLSPKEKQVYGLIREGLDLVHDISYANGHISEELYIKNKGAYTPRLYDVMETPPEVDSFIKQGKRIDNNLYKQRTEVSDWKVENSLNDPVYGLGKRLAQVETNAAIKRYTDYLAKTNFVSDVERSGFTKLSDSPAYGKLAGKWVLNSAAEDLKGFFFSNNAMQNLYDVFRVYDRLGVRQLQKKLLTVFNPTTNVGNIVSDNVFGFLTGVDPLTLNKNLLEMKKNPAKFKQLSDYLMSKNVVGTDITRTDFVNKLGEIDSLAGGEKPGKVKMVAKKVQGFYSGTDDVYKVAAFKSLLDKGFTLEEATRKVADGFQNYANVGKFYDVWAKTPLIGKPFVKFQGDLIRIIKNSAVNNPIGLISFLGTLWGVARLSSKLSGESDEDRKTRENRFAAPMIPGLNIPLTWQTPFGELNVARYISPFYANNETTNMASNMIPFVPNINTKKDVATNIALNMNDPLLAPFAQLAVNRDFRGKPISDPNENKYQPSTLTPSEKLFNQGKFLLRGYTPPPVNSAIDVGVVALGGKDMYGRTQTVPQAAARLAGVKITQFGHEQAVEQRQKDTEYQAKANDFLDTQIKSVQKQLIKGEITPEQANKRIENLKSQKVQLSSESLKSGSGIYQYIDDNDSLQTIDITKVISMPESTNYEKAVKEDAAYKLVSKILDSSLTADEQKQALNDLGITPEDASYYNIARQPNDLKYIYVTDEIGKLNPSDRSQLLNYLVSQRKELNGNMILSNGVVDDLYDDQIITQSERDQLKALSIKNGQVKTKLSGRGKKVTIKKVSIPETKKIAPVKIESMGQLLQMKSYKPKKYQLDLKKYRLNYK